MKKSKSPINVLEHFMVPSMKLVPEGQKSSVLGKFALTDPMQLPRIKKSDPAAVALGAKEGDIIKMEREEPTAKCTYYRVVV